MAFGDTGCGMQLQNWFLQTWGDPPGEEYNNSKSEVGRHWTAEFVEMKWPLLLWVFDLGWGTFQASSARETKPGNSVW